VSDKVTEREDPNREEDFTTDLGNEGNPKLGK
jgi:hypothetical protein